MARFNPSEVHPSGESHEKAQIFTRPVVFDSLGFLCCIRNFRGIYFQ
jgi:hypothetical protein